ncbi:M50 family metallopeptidase [Specibacter cremeus]|uniref:M50 family metallopeptidase n=1 Tax=Specibacter cremeus TaxID=1629051 RepID=UPI000F7692F0|nr:M50 family metallopeptidase [Specibacter cremeus]
MNVAGQPEAAAAAWWHALVAGFARQDGLHVSTPVLLGVLAAVVVLTIPRATWRWFGLYVTFVHELGHAFAALMTGRVVHGLRIALDHSGQLTSSGRGGRGAVWSGFWGYPAPAVVGAALVWSVSAGWAGAALSIGALVLLVTLVFLRNLAGIAVALCSAAIAQALVVFAPPPAVGYIVLALGAALLVGSVRDWFKVAAVHARHRNRLATSDAFILARSTSIPAVLWLAAFAVVIAVAVAGSAYWLLGMATA